tara:strand:+ start:132 stop:434 length:303 start_codon:yes stop_codon:yes gene_type:complete
MYDHHGNPYPIEEMQAQQEQDLFWWAWREEQENDPAFVQLVEKGINHLQQMAAACHPFDMPRLVRFLSHQIKKHDGETIHKLQLAAEQAWSAFTTQHPTQ